MQVGRAYTRDYPSRTVYRPAASTISRPSIPFLIMGIRLPVYYAGVATSTDGTVHIPTFGCSPPHTPTRCITVIALRCAPVSAPEGWSGAGMGYPPMRDRLSEWTALQRQDGCKFHCRIGI